MNAVLMVLLLAAPFVLLGAVVCAIIVAIANAAAAPAPAPRKTDPSVFQTSVDIAAPPDIVWSVMSDGERWPEWTPSVRKVRHLDKGPLRVGSRVLIHQPKFPPAIWRVTALEPGRSFTWRSGGPGMRVHARHSVAPIDGGTRATLALRFEGPLGRLLGRMTRAINDRYLGFEAAGLKRRSEELARG